MDTEQKQGGAHAAFRTVFEQLGRVCLATERLATLSRPTKVAIPTNWYSLVALNSILERFGIQAALRTVAAPISEEEDEDSSEEERKAKQLSLSGTEIWT